MKEVTIGGGKIYTLAQSGTTNIGLPPVLIFGKGSKPSCRADLKSKAKKKIITQKLILNLIEIAERKNDVQLRKSFWNTYYCQNKIISHEKRTYGKYCKNRYCNICLGIRKAELINKYFSELSKWEDPHFVTLTIRSCYAKDLPKMMDGMVRGFTKLMARNRKRYQRGNGIKLMGIKSLECNFNPVKRTYNPHLHIIVPNKKVALKLKAEWLDIWTRKYNEEWCQDIKPVRDMEGSLIEIIKYGTKVFTDPNMKKGKKKEVSPKVYVAAMYNVIHSMQGHRLFDRFGFNLPKSQIDNKIEPTKILNYDSWIYNPSNGDWFSELTGDVLADYQIDIKLQNLLDNNIDTQLQ